MFLSTKILRFTKPAMTLLNGWDPSGGAIYYFNPDTATNAWIWSRPLIKPSANTDFANNMRERENNMERKSIHVWLYTILIVGIIAAVIWVLPQRKKCKST